MHAGRRGRCGRGGNRKLESSCDVVGSGRAGGKGVRRKFLSGCYGGRLASEGDGSKLPGRVAPDGAARSGRSVAVTANRGRGDSPEVRGAAARLWRDLLVELGRRVLGYKQKCLEEPQSSWAGILRPRVLGKATVRWTSR